MAQEIERKFLIDQTHPEVTALMQTKGSHIKQGYIMSDPKGVVRVRRMDDKAYLTIKGPNTGITRDEFEYQIPVEHAEHLLATMCSKIIEKQRYAYPLENGHFAEVDVFPQIDLWLAEVELPTKDTDFQKPDWFRKEVSTDPYYFNNNIAKRI
ncbi:CYTH domain protein [Roseovarius albus]|uniref:CYTH domain protein n=1 Tax=Roseovarius albus TaxID=1247867 RepID=A0A1X6YBM7_9RHOB|nr:CYTH domain-containing protein [Roseovarius albus]SLN16559.1 CYTH domain protein [Roseovarius albus]